MAKRQRFTNEFKRDAVRLWKSSGRPAAASARGGLTEWCRRELGPDGFEAVHADFQGGDVGFEGVDALVELGK